MTARLRKTPAAEEEGAALDPLRARHLALATREVVAPEGRRKVLVDEAESPLAWLARRKGRGGEPLITATQLLAGERLRADFTRAQMTPRVTSQWDAALAQNRRNGGSFGLSASDVAVAARQRVRHALDAVGPEFAGLLLDVCCFLKRLEEAERDRAWPVRSAKIVLQLGLDRLARHYGLAPAAHGPRRSAVRTWLAPDAAFCVGDFSAK